MAPQRAPDRRARAAPASPKRPWWLIGIGLLAAVVVMVATLPASILNRYLARAGLNATVLAGTVWNGQAVALGWQSVPLGDLRWSLAPLSLLAGGVGGRVELTRPDGSVQGDFHVAFGGDLRLTGVQASLPVELLSTLPLGMPRGWRGRLTAEFAEVAVSGGWPTVLRGTLEMDRIIAPPPRNISIGSYHVEMPDPQAGAASEGQLHARVTDKEGPFSFDGRFTLGRDRSFLLEGTLAPRGDTPPPLLRSLELLGPADASGRRPVSVSGTL